MKYNEIKQSSRLGVGGKKKKEIDLLKDLTISLDKYQKSKKKKKKTKKTSGRIPQKWFHI